MKIVKTFIIFLCVFILAGCCEDDSFKKAYCGDKEYDIVSITRWSNSNYVLHLTNGSSIEVHPMNCYFTEGEK